MRISEHADHSQEIVGVRAEDIHKWIDGFFDSEGFDTMLKIGRDPNFNPYEHRKYRHCIEALDEAYQEFEEKYSRSEIKDVFECHIKDDYDGYLPKRSDFENGTFTEKYHEDEHYDDGEIILSNEELSEYFKGKYGSRNKPFSKILYSGFNLRILLPTVMATALFIISIFAIVIPDFRENMMTEKKKTIKELVATAGSVIRFYTEKVKTGDLTTNQAQIKAITEIKKMRYGNENKDYFWITDMTPTMIMHPYRPDLNGKDLSNYRDSSSRSGKKLFVEFVNIVKKQNEGYVKYSWQWKDNKNRTELKLSYVKGFSEWGWIVGTGIYIHDVEKEIARLNKKLFFVFIIISICLTLISISVVMYSKRIENNRIQAEAGLREVKNRYRALVEASNEGYILEIDNQITYANHTLKMMLGFNDEELSKLKIWELLQQPTSETNNLQNMLMRKTQLKDFETRAKTKDGELINVIIGVSKIFFSNKGDHVISFRPIKRNKISSKFELYSNRADNAILETADILKEITNSTDMAKIIQTLNKSSRLIRQITERGARPEILRSTVGAIFDIVTKKTIGFSLKEIGKAPVPFAFISLGSNARHEMTMFSDQDNAIIFEDSTVENKDETKKYFIKLAHSICSKLNEAGYPYCSGGIMAVNPKWCCPLSEWTNNFKFWINEITPQSILDIHVFYDMHCMYGKYELVDNLRAYIHRLIQNNQLSIKHFARSCLSYKAPLDLRGNIRVENNDGVQTLGIKDCLKPIESFARTYALQHSLAEISTTARLFKLQEINLLTKSELDETIYIFDYLWNLRFYNQLQSHEDLKKVSNDIETKKLTEIERQNLTNVLTRISILQEKMSEDFLGISLFMARAQE